jgi:hypothetical protein
MDDVETPIPRALLEEHLAVPRSQIGLADDVRVTKIPPAYYRDFDEPPPPPDDPHWREWPHHNDGREPVSRLLLIGIPVAVGVLGVLHVMAILVVLRLSGM